METFDNEWKNDYENRPILTNGEHILWSGKPRKSAFITANALTMMPIAVVWLCFDLVPISSILRSGGFQLFMLGFFALHLGPVWIWLGSALSAPRRWRNTNYYVTNRRIIIQGGFLAVNEKSLFFKDIRNVHNRVGLFDKVFGTGTIVFNSDLVPTRHNNVSPPTFQYLENAYAVYERVQRTVLDIQTDMEYPNAYRPEENPGYGTDYQW